MLQLRLWRMCAYATVKESLSWQRSEGKDEMDGFSDQSRGAKEVFC